LLKATYPQNSTSSAGFFHSNHLLEKRTKSVICDILLKNDFTTFMKQPSGVPDN